MKYTNRERKILYTILSDRRPAHNRIQIVGGWVGSMRRCRGGTTIAHPLPHHTTHTHKPLASFPYIILVARELRVTNNIVVVVVITRYIYTYMYVYTVRDTNKSRFVACYYARARLNKYQLPTIKTERFALAPRNWGRCGRTKLRSFYLGESRWSVRTNRVRPTNSNVAIGITRYTYSYFVSLVSATVTRGQRASCVR